MSATALKSLSAPRWRSPVLGCDDGEVRRPRTPAAGQRRRGRDGRHARPHRGRWHGRRQVARAATPISAWPSKPSRARAGRMTIEQLARSIEVVTGGLTWEEDFGNGPTRHAGGARPHHGRARLPPGHRARTWSPRSSSPSSCRTPPTASARRWVAAEASARRRAHTGAPRRLAFDQPGRSRCQDRPAHAAPAFLRRPLPDDGTRDAELRRSGTSSSTPRRAPRSPGRERPATAGWPSASP